MKIQLKRSGVLENGSAKKPTKEQTEYGELCVNYNVDDPALFIKDSNDNIIRLAGSGAEAGGLPNGGTGDRPTSPGIGDLFFDTDLNLIVYWDGNNWIPLGSNTIVQDTVPATNYAEGTLWWNSSDDSGQLFILYNDPAGGGGGDLGGPKWVEASPTTGGSGSGAEVLISPTAPAVDDLDEGTLWWNSDSSDLKLYVLYNDPSPDAGKKWIEASPGGGGVSEDDAVLKNPAGGASQNIAGDITLGTDKITLDATAGSATFAGNLQSKGAFVVDARDNLTDGYR